MNAGDPVRGVHNGAWSHVGDALYALPDIELAPIAQQLHELADAAPGRASALWAAFASMVDTELRWRTRT